MGFGKDGRGAILTERDTISLGTLANGAVIKQNNPLAITDDFRLLKSEITMSHTGHTVGEMPIDVYIINDDLSAADVAEAIAAQGPLNKSDRNLSELSERGVFLLATLASGAQGHAVGHRNQHGVIEHKHPWTYTKGIGWSLAAHNNSGAALTTGTIVRFAAKHFGVWVG